MDQEKDRPELLDAGTLHAHPQFATTLAHGLAILGCFANGSPVLGNKDIAEQLGMSRPTVSRLTFTLVGLGYLRRDGRTGKYSLGPAVLSLGYPLLVGELSYRPGLTCAGGQLCPEWRELIERFPTRFMVGSDTWVNQRWDSYDDIMRGYRVWLGGLPPVLAQQIAWGNAADIFGLKPPN